MKTITYNPETHKLPPLPPIDGVLGYTRAQMIDYASKAVKLSHAAPAAEEAPEQDRVQPDSECVEKDGCPTELAVLQQFWREHQQQPATHGEPVAWMTPLGNVFAGYQLTQEVKKDLCPLYTAPQPTPSHIKAMQQTLTALIFAQEHGDFRNGVTDPTGSIDEGNSIASRVLDAAFTALQNALMSVPDGKGSI